MKRILGIGLYLICLTMLNACKSSEPDSVDRAQEQNAQAAIDKKISEFLTEAADGRMMGIEQGKVAKTHSQSIEIKKYGEWMIEDQTKLLRDIKALAGAKKITLPLTLSHQKADGLSDLKEKQGKDFDEKFIKMMIIDHKRDVRAFKAARDFQDLDIQQFATRYLPIIESHLSEIKTLKQAELHGTLSKK